MENSKLSQSLLLELRQIRDCLSQIEQKNTPKSILMDGSEVCILLNISKNTLYNYRRQGVLAPKRIGGKLFYSREQVEVLER